MDLLVLFAVLLLISISLIPAFKMKFWNIGAEGQILIGCLAAAGVCLYFQVNMKDFPNFWVILITLVAIFAVTQMVDNFFFQPFIYSTSIQSTPLEIFIVLLVSGHVGGILGMLAAIPIYTVIRVVAGRFFYNHKAVRRLMPDLEKDVHEMNESIS